VDDIAALLERTLAGDLDSFGVVVARFQDMALGYAYSILGDFHEAQDAAQEAFITAYSNLAELRDPARFAGWFRRIVLSACRTIARKRSAGLPLDDPEAGASAAEDPVRFAERAEMRRAVLSAIGSLSPPNRLATVLFYINGYSVREVAQFLQAPVGTVKRRLQDSRNQLKEKMMGMVEEGLHEQRLSPRFRQEVLKRIRHWERFKGSAEEKAEMVDADPEWVRLVEVEVGLQPISPQCREIRRQIASMEACHEHYLDNVEAIVTMIGTLTPRHVFDCGEACDARKEEAAAYGRALETWRASHAAPPDAGEPTREVFDLLGDLTEEKSRLVSHLIGKLGDSEYRVYADEDEDFERVESRIQHLEICNHNWRENLRIVLQEIAAGKRLFEWRVPGGYHAHGDCPNRIPQLRRIITPLAAWVQGKAEKAGRWGPILGQPTPEKRWLAASLCKHVKAQHEKHGAKRHLRSPTP
jgi:RNA polymerase sigma factor (sigma-70 family)